MLEEPEIEKKLDEAISNAFVEKNNEEEAKPEAQNDVEDFEESDVDEDAVIMNSLPSLK